MTTVLFFPTMRCQLKCEYCHFKTEARKIPYTWTGYGAEHQIEKEVEAQEVLGFLAQLAPYHVEFSGGEPLLWPGFREFVAGIPQGSRWAITSNSLENVEDIDFSKCFGWTSSWHLDHPRFMANIQKLRLHVPIAVSFVVRKDMDDIEDKIGLAMGIHYAGIRPNLLRELNPGVEWEGSPEWERLVQMRQMGWNVVEDEIPPDYHFKKGFHCRGGATYIAIMPDGGIYRCYSDAMDGEPIGHISKPFKLEEASHDCWRPCYGCALDYKAHVRPLES